MAKAEGISVGNLGSDKGVECKGTHLLWRICVCMYICTHIWRYIYVHIYGGHNIIVKEI